jgi:tetratricopeptide (TPR) repeat protein
MPNFALPSWIVAGAAGFALLAGNAAPSFAVGPEPAPAPPKRCAQHKQGTDAWKRCMTRSQKKRKSDVEIYSTGYWLAMSGEHARALDVLRTAGNAADPRVQTMIGFSLRQMGRVDEAMAYYTAALRSAPGLTSTRQYLGEAFLQNGDRSAALGQLGEIERLCGTRDCEHYRLLADAIAKAG